jgi:hypothetical protein
MLGSVEVALQGAETHQLRVLLSKEVEIRRNWLHDRSQLPLRISAFPTTEF